MKPAENGLNRGVMCVYGDLRKRRISNPDYKTNKSAVLAKVYLNANAHITATQLMDKYGYRVSDSIIADNAYIRKAIPQIRRAMF